MDQICQKNIKPGKLIIEKIAKEKGKRYLRLDCDEESAFLNDYHQKKGFVLQEGKSRTANQFPTAQPCMRSNIDIGKLKISIGKMPVLLVYSGFS